MLVCTLGTTPEPIQRAIEELTPARVVLIFSPKYRHLVDGIISCASGNLDDFGPGCCYEVELREEEDHELLDRIVSVVEDEVRPRVREWGKGDGHEVFVDFTGGTKAMAAGLVLSALHWNVANLTFHYVGGARDSGGKVDSGREIPRSQFAPWRVIRLVEIEAYTRLFNAGDFSAAARLAERWKHSGGSIKDHEKEELAALEHLAEAFACWERFDYKNAADRLAKVTKAWNDLNKVLGGAVKGEEQRIRQLADKAQKLKRGDQRQELLLELIANAQRRVNEGRYEDAVARLYRATEALAQIRLSSEHEIDTSKVSLSKLPERFRQKKLQQGSEAEEIKLGLKDAYDLLRELGDELAEKFDKLKMTDLLQKRNLSILAHGFERVDCEAAKNMLCKVMKLADVQEGEVTTFPKLEAR
jgi:CRISPR-associated protein (TIGR02710 family)